MYDPDALYTPRCEHLTPEQEATKLAEMLTAHRRSEARRAPLLAHDRRWRRRAQITMGVAAALALCALFSGLWVVADWARGGDVDHLVGALSGINVGALATLLTVARMIAAWHRRKTASALARTADVAVAVLPFR